MSYIGAGEGENNARAVAVLAAGEAMATRASDIISGAFATRAEGGSEPQAQAIRRQPLVRSRSAGQQARPRAKQMEMEMAVVEQMLGFLNRAPTNEVFGLVENCAGRVAAAASAAAAASGAAATAGGDGVGVGTRAAAVAAGKRVFQLAEGASRGGTLGRLAQEFRFALLSTLTVVKADLARTIRPQGITRVEYGQMRAKEDRQTNEIGDIVAEKYKLLLDELKGEVPAAGAGGGAGNGNDDAAMAGADGSGDKTGDQTNNLGGGTRKNKKKKHRSRNRKRRRHRSRCKRRRRKKTHRN